MPRVLIRLSHNIGDWPLLRQTPGGRGIWGDCLFLPTASSSYEEPDFWVVYDGLPEPEEANVIPGRVIFVTGEPEAFHAYQPDFLAQFGLVVTPHHRIQGTNVVHTQPALPWHIGVRRQVGQGGDSLAHDVARLGYDDFRAARFEKAHDLSVVCSAKSQLEGHRVRLAFVEGLKKHFGDRLHWFGRGIQPIEDKWDAIAPYRFHVSLESSREPHYWTEKLADAYLGGACPLYSGCRNLHDYFERDAFVPIDLDDPRGAIRTIERALAEGITSAREQALARAKAQVLDRYNLFPMIASILGRCPDGERQAVLLRPESYFGSRSPL